MHCKWRVVLKIYAYYNFYVANFMEKPGRLFPQNEGLCRTSSVAGPDQGVVFFPYPTQNDDVVTGHRHRWALQAIY